jgi:hypothetical protein
MTGNFVGNDVGQVGAAPFPALARHLGGPTPAAATDGPPLDLPAAWPVPTRSLRLLYLTKWITLFSRDPGFNVTMVDLVRASSVFLRVRVRRPQGTL